MTVGLGIGIVAVPAFVPTDARWPLVGGCVAVGGVARLVRGPEEPSP